MEKFFLGEMMNGKYFNLYILSSIMLLIFFTSYFTNVGTYSYNEQMQPIPGTYQEVSSEPISFSDVVTSPIDGMIGIDNKAEHNIAYNNSGVMAGSISLMFLILAIGAYMQVINETKVLENFLTNNLSFISVNLKFGVFILMLFFAVGATTHGMYETTIGFAPIIILMYDRLGIKRIEVLYVMLLPLAVGHIGGTINPFATGIASSLLGISITEGMKVRVVLFLILFLISFIIIIYRLKKYNLNDVIVNEKIPYNKIILVLFIVPFIIMIYAFIPNSLLKLDFITVGIMFLISSLIIGLINRFEFETILDLIFNGFKTYLLVAFAIGFARGIYVLLYNSYLSDTLINYMTLLLNGKSFVLVILLLMIFYLVMGFLIPSTSALALVTIPIIGSAMMLIGFEGALTVTIYQSMIGVLKIIAPTSPLVIGLLSLTGVEYITWFKSSIKVVFLFIVIIFLVLIISYGGL
jgi:uncharacterized ion transporter superfamily protein YfcC